MHVYSGTLLMWTATVQAVLSSLFYSKVSAVEGVSMYRSLWRYIRSALYLTICLIASVHL